MGDFQPKCGVDSVMASTCFHLLHPLAMSVNNLYHEALMPAVPAIEKRGNHPEFGEPARDPFLPSMWFSSGVKGMTYACCTPRRGVVGIEPRGQI